MSRTNILPVEKLASDLAASRQFRSAVAQFLIGTGAPADIVSKPRDARSLSRLEQALASAVATHLMDTASPRVGAL